MSTRRGLFIVVEGLDRAGKSTQVSTLCHALSARLHKFPDRTTSTGQMIDSYLTSHTAHLDDRSIHLLFSANRWEAMASLCATLEQGTHVVADRYAFSGVAYSVAKGLPYKWCRAPDEGLLRPDLILFLDIDPEVARSRGKYGEERYEKEELQRKVRSVFRTIENDVAAAGQTRWVSVDAGQSIEQVQSQVTAAVAALQNASAGDRAPLSMTLFSHPALEDA